jgi:NADPH:quinone reductase-like Zn-dependent oxidoreductase
VKAIVQDRFGPPDILRPADIDPPRVGPGDVLVRVHAAALNPYDWHLMRGDPLVGRLTAGMGLTRPKSPLPGIDAAGRVEAVGADVAGLRPGDEVMGFCAGSLAEYACTTPERLVRKPAGLSFEQAAAVPMGAVSALRGIRTVGRARVGQRVLVNGAGGGVGTFAVQIAAALGAEVTGVCSTGNVELVRSLGAAHVVEYTREDFTDAGARSRYDLVLDNVGNQPLRRLRRVLTPAGTLVANGGGPPGKVFGVMGGLLRLLVVNAFVRQHLRVILPAVPDGPIHEDLVAVAELVEAGTLAPVVDRTYPLVDAAEGIRHVEKGHARGKVVVTVPG